MAQSTVKDIPPNVSQILCLGLGLDAEVGMTDLFLYQVAHCIVVGNSKPSNC